MLKSPVISNPFFVICFFSSQFSLYILCYHLLWALVLGSFLFNLFPSIIHLFVIYSIFESFPHLCLPSLLLHFYFYHIFVYQKFLASNCSSLPIFCFIGAITFPFFPQILNHEYFVLGNFFLFLAFSSMLFFFLFVLVYFSCWRLSLHVWSP